MRHQGKLTEGKDAQGFGFITPESGGRKVFVHIKSFVNRQQRPVGNEIVTYELKTDAHGKTRAEIVAFLGDPLPSATLPRVGNCPAILSIAFFISFLSG